MIKTGYISFITETGGGQDEATGSMLPSTETPSAYLECNLKTITRELVFEVDGQYRKAKFQVYIDQDVVSGIDLQSISFVQLQDNNGNDLGKHQIMNVEYLNLTQRVEIAID